MGLIAGDFILICLRHRLDDEPMLIIGQARAVLGFTITDDRVIALWIVRCGHMAEEGSVKGTTEVETPIGQV
jgi:hypothetical protein